MKVVISTLILLACAGLLESQIVASLDRSPAGTPEVRIRNDAPIGITAFAVAINPVPGEADHRGPCMLFFDATIDEALPLQPNQERTFPIMFRGRPGRKVEELFEPPVMTAGVLEDGSTTGDPVLLARIVARRGNMLLAVETTLEMLSEAGRHNVPREQLVEQFIKLANSLWRWYVPVEQQVGRGLYLSTADKLSNVPEGGVGSPFPPSAFVADETAILNRRRVLLLESQPGFTSATLIPAVRH
jgi:hypothetical protein